MVDPTRISANPGRPPVGRRKFLITSTLGLSGILLFPLKRAYASPVLEAVGDFSDSVGASVTANTIDGYLSSRGVDSSTADEVRRTNNEMAQIGGFSDLSRSLVYVPGQEVTYFFYPARNVDGFNACIAFFDRSYNPGSRQIALVEGPTLFGVGALSREVSKKHGKHVAKRVMLPRETLQRSGGTMQRSYPRHDIYRTRAGKVSAIYKNHGNGKGTVTVEARDERGTLLAGGDYDLTYRTSE
jgi:hypothetical protein